MYAGPGPSLHLVIRLALASCLVAACGPLGRVDRAFPLDGGEGGEGGLGGEAGGGGGGGTGGVSGSGGSGAGGGGQGGGGGGGNGDAGGGSGGVAGSGGSGGAGGGGTGGADAGSSGGTGGGSGGSGGTGGGSGGTGVQPPVAPSGLTAVPGDALITVSWSPVSGATSYNVKRAVSGAPFAIVAPAIAATRYVDDGLTNGEVYYYTVSASNSAGEGPSSVVTSATPYAPMTWSSQDIGPVGVPGSWSQNGSSHTVNGAGADIWNESDAFRFVYRSISGDATVTARATSLQAVHIWSKAAVMMRDGLAADARHVTVLTSPTYDHGYRLQARTATAALTTTERDGTGTTPVWFRLVRRGNDFTGYVSSNGSSWRVLGTTKTINMPGTIAVGLAVTSHSTTETATATFENVSITTP